MKSGAKFKGSTSSVSSSLSHLYYLFSRHRPVNLHNFSENIRGLSSKFTPAARQAAVIQLLPNEGLFSVNRLAPFKKDTILSEIGKSYERMVTMGREEFEKAFLKSRATGTSSHILPDVYSYLSAGKLYFRSQLDCQDPEVGVFDLKSRAVQPLRLAKEDPNTTSYQITSLTGLTKSFEVEYYDLVRSTLLRNIFQVWIGNMAGIFVAYHNTREIFGYEFLNKDEMEASLFQSRRMARLAFDSGLKLFELLLDAIVSEYGPNDPIRITMKTETTPRGTNTIIFSELDDLEGLPAEMPTLLKPRRLKAFRLTLEIVVDDYFVDGPSHILDDSDVKIFYKLEPIKPSSPAVLQSYVAFIGELYSNRLDANSPTPVPPTLDLMEDKV